MFLSISHEIIGTFLLHKAYKIVLSNGRNISLYDDDKSKSGLWYKPSGRKD